MYGYYKKIRNEFTGVLTGRAREYGGSLIRPEATGYGSVYFGAEMLATRKKDYKGLRCIVSGKGNVTQYTIEKINQLGGKALSISDSGGTIIDEEGIDAEKLKYVMELAEVKRGRAKEYADKYKSAKYYEGKSVWDVVKEQGIKFDCAFPSATQNEINENHAAAMVKNGCFLVSEGANMPSNLAAIKIYQDNNVLYGPAKAANAGGVATSGLEMAQQSCPLVLGPQRGRPEAAADHEGHPPAVPGRLRDLRHQGRLPGRRQHRRVRQSSQGHGGPGRGIIPLHFADNSWPRSVQA